MVPVRLETRTLLHELLHEGGPARVAEIGVFKGEYARYLLDVVCAHPDSELHLIDPWAPGPVVSGDADGNDVVSYDGRDLFDVVVREFAYDPRVRIHRGYSHQVIPSFPDAHFDLVYIDGDHSYEGVARDLELAHACVREGGWIMGHDYEMNSEKARHLYDFGVKRAVGEYCAARRQRVAALAMDGCVSFAIQKTST